MTSLSKLIKAKSPMQILCKFKIPVFLAICSDLGLFIHPRMIMAGDEVRPPRPMDQGCPVRGHVG